VSSWPLGYECYDSVSHAEDIPSMEEVSPPSGNGIALMQGVEGMAGPGCRAGSLLSRQGYRIGPGPSVTPTPQCRLCNAWDPFAASWCMSSWLAPRSYVMWSSYNWGKRWNPSFYSLLPVSIWSKRNIHQKAKRETTEYSSSFQDMVFKSKNCLFFLTSHKTASCREPRQIKFPPPKRTLPRNYFSCK
jgi:hypothetical protein